MCHAMDGGQGNGGGCRKVPLNEAVGMVLGHDVTEIRKDEFKGRAFKKGHIVRQEDIGHLRRLGKEHLFVLSVADDEIHEDDAAYRIARALMGQGVAMQTGPREGKINLVATMDGLLKVNVEALLRVNILGDVMCATLHTNSTVWRGQVIAGTRAIPLILKRSVIDEVAIVAAHAGPILEVRGFRRPKVGIVITGNEVFYRRIQDAFAPVIERKVQEFGGEIVGIYFAPDDQDVIAKQLSELMDAGADLLITTGGMSVDPDDVTRFAVRALGASDMTYGSSVLPGAMFLVAYVPSRAQHGLPIPVLGVPACGMYHRTTVLDLILPRVLAGELIGRRDLAELGHGGLCLSCTDCHYPVCPFGKG